MASIIALTIILIASVKDNKVKALIYSLPIPITFALIATKSNIDNSHVIGLFLLSAFLWSVFYLSKKLKIPVFLSDILCSLGYVILGFIFIKLLPTGFWELTAIYFLSWVISLKRYTPIPEKSKKDELHSLIKGSIVFPIALGLLFLKSFLRGIVVTFPFSGIFAVWEVREALYTLAGEFTKNSLAILIFFIVIKISSQYIGFYPSIGLGWLFYLPVFLCLQKIKK